MCDNEKEIYNIFLLLFIILDVNINVRKERTNYIINLFY